MEGNRIKKFRYLVVAAMLMLGASNIVAEIANTEIDIVQAYELHRQEFLDRRTAEEKRFENIKGNVPYSDKFVEKQLQISERDKSLQELKEKVDNHLLGIESKRSEIQLRVKNAEKVVEIERKKISNEERKIREAEISLTIFETTRNTLFGWFFPMIGAVNVFSVFSEGLSELRTNILIALITIWSANIYLVLWRKEKELMRRYKWWITGVFVIVIMLNSAPVLSQEETKEDEIINKLEMVDDIIGKSDHRRFITILENKPEQYIDIPELEIDDEYLIIINTIERDSAEYYITLAALYAHEKQYGNAVAIINNISKSSIKIENKNVHTVVISAIAFLIEHQQKEAATTILSAHADKLTSIDEIIVLSEFLDKKSMQTSSDELLHRAINLAKLPEDLLKLARVYEKTDDLIRASEALKKAISVTKNSTLLIEISEMAKDMHMPDIASFALDKAIETASATIELIALNEYTQKIKNTEKSMEALRKALERSENPDDIYLVVEKALENDYDDVISSVNQKVKSTFSKDEKLELINVYLKNGRSEDAIIIFDMLIGSIKRGDVEKERKLLELADFAIDKSMLEQAKNAIERLAILTGSKNIDIHVVPNNRLRKAEGLPSREMLELQVYYGMINEELGFDNKAKEYYQNSVRRTLEGILDSYGYKIPTDINNFYLLGRVLKNVKKYSYLHKLDGVFVDVEENILRSIRAEHDEEISRLQAVKDERGYELLNTRAQSQEDYERSLKDREIRQSERINKSISNLNDRLLYLQRDLSNKKIQLEQEKNNVKNRMKEILLLKVSIITEIFFFISIIVGSALWAYFKHARHMSAHKLAGFVGKYAETEGWMRMLSVLGVVSGVLIVLASQVAGIFIGIYEQLSIINKNTRKSDQKLAKDIES